MDESNTETNFLLDLLRYTPATETARIHEKLQKAHEQEQCVVLALKRAIHLAVLGTGSFLLTAFSLPHVSDRMIEPLAKVSFLVSCSSSFCALVFLFVWYHCRKDLSLKQERCRIALREHLQPQLELAVSNQAPARKRPLAPTEEQSTQEEEITCIPFRKPASEVPIMDPSFLGEMARARAS
jgi:hypothetical protein